jgi:abortive infection bacteriophage resistance protein
MGRHFFVKDGLGTMDTKEPKTFDEQVTLIEEKGFFVSDREECKQFLMKVNYYRLSAYYLPFRKTDGSYYKDVPFKRIQRIYEFDSRLRALLFEIIEDIELFLRTNIAYYVAHKHGALSYLDKAMFSDRHSSERFSARIKRCIEENEKTLVVQHHKKKYEGSFPIWVIIDFFSVGMLSHFYCDMRTEDKKAIVSKLYKRVGVMQLESWLRCLTDKLSY